MVSFNAWVSVVTGVVYIALYSQTKDSTHLIIGNMWLIGGIIADRIDGSKK